jgi:hypothetical protein
MFKHTKKSNNLCIRQAYVTTYHLSMLWTLSGSVDLFLNVCSGAFQFPSFLLAGAYYFFSQVISCAGDSLLASDACKH